ncbi:LLM class flavin-dependent oxidoreductase [Nocardiopsis sp. FIRDI 009]|uniref:LLM class flavin-dependent oxidoreductase n=1 Tax=Nocardiopsis sp. FIRDI 009 TaxID=714197 RepID=UPI000E22756A|nr:LLM class flavin-dependent oxidoreductase [Nocardiopsis sp. FIRDI 009]
MTAYSVLVPFLPRRTEQILPLAALVNWTNAERLWQGQALMMEPHQGFVSAAGAGFRVPTGFGVTLMPLRHPYEAALQARSVAMATGRSVVAGYGPGARPFQASVMGSPYRSPLTAAREYLTAVRGLLDGDVVDQDGTYFTVRAQLPPCAAPRVDVGLGVLRPGMARLAGEVADVAISWLTPAAYIRDVLAPAIREGADRAGRSAPRITAMVPVALARPGSPPEELALASNAAHLQAPHYIDMLRRAGVRVDGGSPEDAARALVEGNAFVSGDADRVTALLREYEEAGVDEIVLNTTGVHKTHGQNEAVSDLRTILAAVTR